MPKQLFRGLLLMLLVPLAAGCASSNAKKTTTTGGAVTTRAYVADKERVDQGMDSGNFGFLAGTPQPADRSNLKKTRKVYVVEVTKAPGEVSDEITTTTETTSSYTPPAEKHAEEPRGRKIELPDFDEEPGRAAVSRSAADEPDAALGGGQSYTVEKNDTLQKISKKFYGTFSKWPQIYEANKAVIPNPNRIKQGMVLQIP